MRTKTCLCIFIAFIFYFNPGDCMARKFLSPGKQIEGVWVIAGYDFREFATLPKDIDIQLNDESGGFPVGQKISFKKEGSVIMPGSIDPISMKSRGPTGDLLEMTLLQPFSDDLCKRNAWDFICKSRTKNYTQDVMVSNIEKLSGDALNESKEIWPEFSPIVYTITDLGRSFSFDILVSKDLSSMVIPIIVDGAAKNGNPAAAMGVVLKRLSK